MAGMIRTRRGSITWYLHTSASWNRQIRAGKGRRSRGGGWLTRTSRVSRCSQTSRKGLVSLISAMMTLTAMTQSTTVRKGGFQSSLCFILKRASTRRNHKIAFAKVMYYSKTHICSQMWVTKIESFMKIPPKDRGIEKKWDRKPRTLRLIAGSHRSYYKRCEKSSMCHLVS